MPTAAATSTAKATSAPRRRMIDAVLGQRRVVLHPPPGRIAPQANDLVTVCYLREGDAMSEPFDLIVIGGGSAARAAADKAESDYAARVALVERERWGGSCPNVACSPTKAYLVAAELAHDFNRRAPVLGIETGPARVDLARVRAWKESLKRTQEAWVRDLEAAGLTPISGQATFTGPHALRVGERELEADRILVATGSRTAVPPVEGIDDIDWLDHVSALDLTEVPRSLLVVGAGAVGLEFGQVFARF